MAKWIAGWIAIYQAILAQLRPTPKQQIAVPPIFPTPKPICWYDDAATAHDDDEDDEDDYDGDGYLDNWDYWDDGYFDDDDEWDDDDDEWDDDDWDWDEDDY